MTDSFDLFPSVLNTTSHQQDKHKTDSTALYHIKPAPVTWKGLTWDAYMKPIPKTSRIAHRTPLGSLPPPQPHQPFVNGNINPLAFQLSRQSWKQRKGPLQNRTGPRKKLQPNRKRTRQMQGQQLRNEKNELPKQKHGPKKSRHFKQQHPRLRTMLQPNQQRPKPKKKRLPRPKQQLLQKWKQKLQLRPGQKLSLRRGKQQCSKPKLQCSPRPKQLLLPKLQPRPGQKPPPRRGKRHECGLPTSWPRSPSGLQGWRPIPARESSRSSSRQIGRQRQQQRQRRPHGAGGGGGGGV